MKEIIRHADHMQHNIKKSSDWNVIIKHKSSKIRKYFVIIKYLKNHSYLVVRFIKEVRWNGFKQAFKLARAKVNGVNGREAQSQLSKLEYEVAPVEFVPRLPLDQAVENKTVRVICFYLPQFHSILENDDWWGKGFTEWTNVRQGLPQFEGHYQPHIPHDDIGYYNLLDRNVQAKQIELAKQYGIEGFCYYLYWFSGQRLLEKPLDNMLADQTLDLPFCICWANENWSKRWDGKDLDLLMVQNYSDEDDLAFIAHVSKYFRDSRYIKVDNKPMLIVYRPDLFPNMKMTSERWRNWCRRNGIGEIYLAYTQLFRYKPPKFYGFDAAIEFPPNNSNFPQIMDQVKDLKDDFGGKIYDWRAFLKLSEVYEDKPYTLFRSVTPSWDNTARRKNNGTIFNNSCPKLFTKSLVNAFKYTIQKFDQLDKRIVFINAWNEWGEGAHLEPDQRYGYAWLQSVYDAHDTTSQNRKRILLVSHDAHRHGAQVLSFWFAKFSQKLHFDVEMIVLDGGSMLSKFKQYANVKQLNFKAIEKRKLIKYLIALRNNSIGAAIVNTTVSGKIIPYLKQAGFSVVSLIHELPGVLNSMHLKDHAMVIADEADCIIFPTKQVQEGFEVFVNKKLTQARIRPQGIFRPSILRLGSDKVEISKKVRRDLSLPSDAQLILNIAYADHRKGFDYFIQACCQVMKINPKAYGLWVGHKDQAFVEKVMDYVKQQGLENRFIFTGFVDDPREYYVAADVFALTSREDPFPSVVMEALDALTPVVAFKECGGFETLLSRGCGLLVEKGNVAEFTRAVRILLQDKKFARKLAEKGQQIVQTELSFYHYLYDILEFAGKPLLKISVAVPNYNYAKYIESRLDSIIKQTYPIYELIVLDDASTDNSVEVIQNCLKKVNIPNRFVINEKNSGSVFKQWQKAVELAQGDYLWVAEADDLTDPNFLEKLVYFFENRDVVLAFSQSKQMDQDAKELANDYLDYTKDVGDYWREDYIIDGIEEIKRALCIKNTIPNVSGVLFNKSILDEVMKQLEKELPNYKVAGDWLVYVNVLEHGKIGFCKDSLNFHRRHVSSATKVNNHFGEIVCIQDEVLSKYSIPNSMKEKILAYRKCFGKK
jgi:glycosyltransferase involved in cell wall biosynthesis